MATERWARARMSGTRNVVVSVNMIGLLRISTEPTLYMTKQGATFDSSGGNNAECSLYLMNSISQVSLHNIHSRAPV